jgi:hypothetical protein
MVCIMDHSERGSDDLVYSLSSFWLACQATRWWVIQLGHRIIEIKCFLLY